MDSGDNVVFDCKRPIYPLKSSTAGWQGYATDTSFTQHQATSRFLEGDYSTTEGHPATHTHVSGAPACHVAEGMDGGFFVDRWAPSQYFVNLPRVMCPYASRRKRK